MRRLAILLVLGLAVTAPLHSQQLTPPAGLTPQQQAAQQAQVIAAGTVVAQFHQMFNAGQYGAIWAAAAPNLQQGANQAQFIAAMTAYRGQVGMYVSHVLVGDVVTDNSAGNYATLSYNVTFANGTATESFVIQMIDGQPKIAYFSYKNVQASGG